MAAADRQAFLSKLPRPLLNRFDSERTQMNALSPLWHALRPTKQPALRRPWRIGAVLTACTLATAGACWAQGTVLVQGPLAQVTTTDVQAQLAVLPPERQSQILQSPDTLRAMVDNIYQRRASAARAQQQNLHQQPAVQLKLEQAREGILAEAYVAERDKLTAPSDQIKETYARGVYKAEPQRFEIPAETKASHLLIRGTTPEAQAKAESLLTQIKAGASFEDLTKKHSEDPGNASRGGDLGWFAKGRMVKPFQDAVDALKAPGDISPVVATSFGYHIIRLDDRKPASVRTYDEVKKDLYAEAVLKAQQEQRQKLMRELRAESKGDETALQSFIEAEKAARQ